MINRFFRVVLVVKFRLRVIVARFFFNDIRKYPLAEIFFVIDEFSQVSDAAIKEKIVLSLFFSILAVIVA